MFVDPSIHDQLSHVLMCQPSPTYKPFRYQWAEDAAIKQQRVHWIPEEATLGLDAKDYIELPDHERYLLDNALKLFTQSDIDIADDYMGMYIPIFRNGEIKRMLETFLGMECVHIRAYSMVNDTIGSPDSMYGEFLEVEAMRDKHEMLTGFEIKTPEDVATTLALVSGFGEGLQLYSSFALMLNFTRIGKMNGLGQILQWSIRDEEMHVEGIGNLFHGFINEAHISRSKIRDRVMEGVERVIMLEDLFIDHCFAKEAPRGLRPEEMKKYTRYTADVRLANLGFPTVYGIDDHPLEWLIPLTSAVEHANFFETRSTEYSKGATQGEWNEVWQEFDRTKKVAPVPIAAV